MDGKKTYLGLFLTAALWAVKGFMPDLMPDNIFAALLPMTLALTGAGAIHKLQKFAVVIRDALNELIKTLPKGPAIIFLCLCLPVLGGCTMPWQESQEAKDASEFRTKSYGSFAANMERIVEALNQAYKRAEFERIDLLYQMDVDALKANYAKAAVKEPAGLIKGMQTLEQRRKDAQTKVLAKLNEMAQIMMTARKDLTIAAELDGIIGTYRSQGMDTKAVQQAAAGILEMIKEKTK